MFTEYIFILRILQTATECTPFLLCVQMAQYSTKRFSHVNGGKFEHNVEACYIYPLLNKLIYM